MSQLHFIYLKGIIKYILPKVPFTNGTPCIITYFMRIFNLYYFLTELLFEELQAVQSIYVYILYDARILFEEYLKGSVREK